METKNCHPRFCTLNDAGQVKTVCSKEVNFVLANIFCYICYIFYSLPAKIQSSQVFQNSYLTGYVLFSLNSNYCKLLLQSLNVFLSC